MLQRLRKNKFQAHSVAFGLMILASVGMIFTLRSEANALSWVLIGLFAAANGLALLIR